MIFWENVLVLLFIVSVLMTIFYCELNTYDQITVGFMVSSLVHRSEPLLLNAHIFKICLFDELTICIFVSFFISVVYINSDILHL